MKNKNSYNTALYVGAIPLVGGVTIFLIWWLARAWFAIDLNGLELYGFLWIFASIPVAIIALGISIYVFYTNYNVALIKGAAPLLITLANIPMVYLILTVQSIIGNRAYIKFVNESGIDSIELTLNSKTFNKQLGMLDNNRSLINYFHPSYKNEHWDSVPLMDSVTIIIQSSEYERSVILPPIYKSNCGIIVIDEKFNIKDSGRFNP